MSCVVAVVVMISPDPDSSPLSSSDLLVVADVDIVVHELMRVELGLAMDVVVVVVESAIEAVMMVAAVVVVDVVVMGTKVVE